MPTATVNVNDISQDYSKATVQNDEMTQFRCRLNLIHIDELHNVAYKLEKYGGLGHNRWLATPTATAH